jgi:pimeloyl-ACP methyl ester carboxylesterase
MSTQLPIRNECAGRSTTGFCTPTEDKTVQKMKVPPRRVIPIIFLPGIMGSNLRMSAARQAQLHKSNNIARRPDRPLEAAKMMRATPATRQLQLDPTETEVDIYDPVKNITGNSKETASDRHGNGDIHVFLDGDKGSPLLFDDPRALPNRKTKEQKAKERGWGEVYFSSYRTVLEGCEKYLNSSFTGGFWTTILDQNPQNWMAATRSQPRLPPLTTDQFRAATKACFFPVHAMGYNWLQGNEISAINLKQRIRDLIDSYIAAQFECEKVILVTHSMGGLVARALIHPAFANASSMILGIVHGVMPALGAPAAYKRMRCGFEQGVLHMSLTARVLGDTGAKVTAVLGNSTGGLQLLPSKAYGNGWLQIRRNKVLFDAFPKNGDPYNEIYKLEGRWYGLLRPKWLNPAADKTSGIRKTKSLLDKVSKFHDTLSGVYHPISYGHYGADTDRPSWETVTWNLGADFAGADWHLLTIKGDDQQGELQLAEGSPPNGRRPLVGQARLGPSTGAGDETVPLKSADDQLLNGKFRGVFRQQGYEHQSSYGDQNALRSTLYSIVRIVENMRWENHAP